MRIVRQIRELDCVRKGRVGLVPTMGAFHDGHLSLMRAARESCDTVVVSLFVNPTQFGPHEDYLRYPRDEAHDLFLAETVDVDVVFAPMVETMYPRKTTTIHVAGVADLWEGAHRPGHFDGVATVVCKLLNIVRPDVAYFGIKDYQQCAVVRTMVEDLNLPVALDFRPTLREADGLAMSSRNRYLGEGERQRAAGLYRILTDCAQRIRSGTEARVALAAGRDGLVELGFVLDYLALVDPQSLQEVQAIEGEGRLIAAARLGSVRLIDNVPV